MITEDEKKKGKTCFIITPIGDDNSAIFRKAKGVIESVIKPTLENYGFGDIKPAYEINISGMINTQIINRIINDDLVIVNLTGKNPNVMYELCLRHVVAKPIIHVCEVETVLPFDIKDSRTIFYTDDMLGVAELKRKMELFMDEIDYTKEYQDNPIYTAAKMDQLLKDVDNSNRMGTAEHEMLKQILEILSNTQMTDNVVNENGRNRRYVFLLKTRASKKEMEEIILKCVPNELIKLKTISDGKYIISTENKYNISAVINALFKRKLDASLEVLS